MKLHNGLKSLLKQVNAHYRVTRTYKSMMKRVCFKVEMHCQHFRKKLTGKQLSLKKIKPKKMLSSVRCKKISVFFNFKSKESFKSIVALIELT